MRIPIAKRYVLVIFLRYLLLSVGIFTGLMMMVNFMQIVHSGALSGFSFYFLGKSILFMLPNVIGMCLPVAFMIALLLALGQMSKDGEIIALRAGGYSFFEIFSWVFGASVLLSVTLFYINNSAGPECLARSTDYARIMLQRISRIDLKPRTFQKISDWSLYAEDVNSITGEMKGVKLIQRNDRDSSSVVMLMNAGRGWYRASGDKGMLVQLYDGQFSQTDSRNPGRLINGSFSSYETVLDFFTGDRKKKIEKRELSSRELFRLADSGKFDAEDTGSFRCEAVSRIALSFGPLLFFLIGTPLGVVLDKSGKSGTIVLSLLILFFYYGFTIGGMMLARRHEFFYPWVMFVPSAVCLIAGGILWKKRLSGR